MMSIGKATQEFGHMFMVAESFSGSPQKQLGEVPKPEGKWSVMVSSHSGIIVNAKQMRSDEEISKLHIAIHLCSEELQLMRTQAYYAPQGLRRIDWVDELGRMQAGMPRRP